MEKSVVENTKNNKVEGPLSKISGKWSVKPCRKSWLHAINPKNSERKRGMIQSKIDQKD